jgi:hypothetical protein
MKLRCLEKAKKAKQNERAGEYEWVYCIQLILVESKIKNKCEKPGGLRWDSVARWVPLRSRVVDLGLLGYFLDNGPGNKSWGQTEGKKHPAKGEVKSWRSWIKMHLLQKCTHPQGEFWARTTLRKDLRRKHSVYCSLYSPLWLYHQTSASHVIWTFPWEESMIICDEALFSKSMSREGLSWATSATTSGSWRMCPERWGLAGLQVFSPKPLGSETQLERLA